jgi:hypothetical protein
MPVAVIVKLPVFVIVTLCELRTPFVNDAVVIGAPTSVPVELSITLLPLPLKLVTVLPLASSAVTAILNAVPAVCGLLMVAKTKWLSAPGLTVKLLLVAPVSGPSEAAKVKVPATVGTRFEKVATPLAAATVVVEPPLNAPPLLIVIETFEASEDTRLPNWSCTCTITAGAIGEPA